MTNCKLCLKDFEPSHRNPNAVFCGRGCSNRSHIGRSTRPKTAVKLNCRHCNAEFEALPSDIKRGGGIFCTNECMGKSRRKA